MKLNQIKSTVQSNFENTYNCIPYGFIRMRKRLPGIIKGDYTCITSGTGVGKSKFLRFYIIENVLNFVKNVNDESKLDVKFFVFSLELSALEFKAEMLCALLWRDHQIELDFRELMSIPEERERKLDQRTIDLIDSYDSWFEYFDSKVDLVSTVRKATDIYNRITRWVKKQGKEIEYEDKDGNTVKEWTYFNPNLFVVPIIDHISLIEPEVNPSTKEPLGLHGSMALCSTKYMLHLKNYYHCHPHVVQQQALDKERIELDYSGKPKEQKLEPSLDGIANNKEIARDYTCVIGIFAPARYDFPAHAEYDITILGDNYRSVKVLKSRYTAPNARVGLWFNGAVGHFQELPPADKLKTQLDYDKLLKTLKKQ